MLSVWVAAGRDEVFTRTPWLWKAVIGGNIAVLACHLLSRSSTAKSHPELSGWLPPSPQTGPSQTHTCARKEREKGLRGFQNDYGGEWLVNFYS